MAAAPRAAAPQPQPGPRQPQPAPRQPQPGPRHPRPAARQPTAPPRQPPMAAPRKPPNPPNPPPRQPPTTRADAVSTMSRQMPVAIAAVSISIDLRIVFLLSKFRFSTHGRPAAAGGAIGDCPQTWADLPVASVRGRDDEHGVAPANGRRRGRLFRGWAAGAGVMSMGSLPRMVGGGGGGGGSSPASPHWFVMSLGRVL